MQELETLVMDHRPIAIGEIGLGELPDVQASATPTVLIYSDRLRQAPPLTCQPADEALPAFAGPSRNPRLAAIPALPPS
jgi:hypothetical protein